MIQSVPLHDLDEKVQRATAIVKNSGGFLHAREEWLLTIEVPKDRVWQLHKLRLSLIARNYDRVFYDVD
jgi:hypothetical protein